MGGRHRAQPPGGGTVMLIQTHSTKLESAPFPREMPARSRRARISKQKTKSKRGPSGRNDPQDDDPNRIVSVPPRNSNATATAKVMRPPSRSSTDRDAKVAQDDDPDRIVSVPPRNSNAAAKTYGRPSRHIPSGRKKARKAAATNSRAEAKAKSRFSNINDQTR